MTDSDQVRRLRAAIIQNDDTDAVLMLGWMDEEAAALTKETGLVHFWSRSRQQIWKKGAESGNTFELVSMVSDCDDDALLVRVRPSGPACHTGAETCWGSAPRQGFARLEALWAVIDSRAVVRPSNSYTVQLLAGGPDLPARKVVEEATEVLIAAKDHALGNATDDRIAEEAADLLYHLLVLLRERSVAPRTVFDQLAQRR